MTVELEPSDEARDFEKIDSGLPDKAAAISRCPRCKLPVGIEVKADLVFGLCIRHGVVYCIEKIRLNGQLDWLKFGGTE